MADDNSPDLNVVKILKEYSLKDERIKLVERKNNGHISEASNSALEIASGEFVALIDHDDKIDKDAFYYIINEINKFPEAKVLYSDEDKIDEANNRKSPHFKSDWNPDLFFSQNYVSHLGVYRTDIIRRIGGFRRGVEGAQDQDLLLRCLPYVKDSEIKHIPRILYHWRMIQGSTALASGEKDYTSLAGVKALSDYFQSEGPERIQVRHGLLPNTYRVIWPLPESQPLVTLLIPTRDMKDVTETAVNSILEKTSYKNYEILILDNGSVNPETIEWFDLIQKNNENVKVLKYDFPFNYSAINNFGVENANGSIVGLVNNDIEVISSDWLDEMVRHAIRPEIGCVGAKLYYSNGTIQHAGVILGIGGVANHPHKNFKKHHPGYFGKLVCTQNFSAVTAAVLLVEKEIFLKVGGLNEQNLAIAFNDVDFCLKVMAEGYRNLFTPYAELYHHESISRGKEDTPEKISRFHSEIEYMQKEWRHFIEHDPYYNVNLTKEIDDYSISMKVN
ncbi:glycosyl transferase [Alteromonas confluentis]|uniref:Glycosyl transferase n=1 Tax=Alteromonas confluentis TaxID=1656094 RepID=A0A1E7ZAG7_9ALTE|nr:glycosyl transferase [Alteromonas confluentis]